MSTVKLKDFMRTIRVELEAANKEMNTEKQSALFELQELKLELSVLVNETKEKEGGAEIWILSGKQSRSNKSEIVQTVRLTYKIAPLPNGASRIGDRFHSSGDQQHQEEVVKVLRKRTS